MAHLGKDSYSHIHFDDHQARTISVREAARLQSFPDGFVFTGSMNSAFRADRQCGALRCSLWPLVRSYVSNSLEDGLLCSASEQPLWRQHGDR